MVWLKMWKKYVEVSSDSKMFNAYLVSVGTSHSRKKHLVRFCASSNKISSFWEGGWWQANQCSPSHEDDLEKNEWYFSEVANSISHLMGRWYERYIYIYAHALSKYQLSGTFLIGSVSECRALVYLELTLKVQPKLDVGEVPTKGAYTESMDRFVCFLCFQQNGLIG